MTDYVTADEINQVFRENLAEVLEEPAFQRLADNAKVAVDDSGEPLVKLAVANVPLDYDLWEGLRNPAVVGLYPAGLPELWDFYATRRKDKVDESGRATIFQIPRSYEFAQGQYRRAWIISAMLPFSSRIVDDYTSHVIERKRGSSHLYASMYNDVNKILDKTVTRAAIDLMTDDSVVIAMNNDNVTNVSKETIPQTRQGNSHGPSKGGNYPQKSIAALLGLGQFGIGKFFFRDELDNGRVQRFAGPIRSIVGFDKLEVVRDGSHGILYPSSAWREFLMQLYDFTNIDPEVNQYRFCSYAPSNDNGCGECGDCCPSGAQINSVPDLTGQYSENVLKQTHRFWEGQLQFDYGKCCDDRGQMAGLLSEWACARCISTCLVKGKKRKLAVESFYQKMTELMREPEVSRVPVG